MREFTTQYVKRRFPLSAIANDIPGLISALLAYAIAAYAVVALTADGIASDSIRGLSYAVRAFGSAYCLGGAILAWRFFSGSLPDESELDENGQRKVPYEKKEKPTSGVTVIKKDVPTASTAPTAETDSAETATDAKNAPANTAAEANIAEDTAKK